MTYGSGGTESMVNSALHCAESRTGCDGEEVKWSWSSHRALAEDKAASAGHTWSNGFGSDSLTRMVIWRTRH
jgi:hypothetical protein